MEYGIDSYKSENNAPHNQIERDICEYCNGEGEYYESCCGDAIEADTQLCPQCGEHTDGEAQTCEFCKGTGYEPIDE